jgi:hypothetical protein
VRLYSINVCAFKKQSKEQKSEVSLSPSTTTMKEKKKELYVCHSPHLEKRIYMYKGDEHMEKALVIVCQNYDYVLTDIVFHIITFSLFSYKGTRRINTCSLFLLNKTIGGRIMIILLLNNRIYLISLLHS